MTRNCRKMIKQMGVSLLLSKHSIQLLDLFLLLSGRKEQKVNKYYENHDSSKVSLENLFRITYTYLNQFEDMRIQSNV